MPKRVVISLHGIRTRGVWQKDLVPILARAGFIPYALDYGNFGVPSLVWRPSRDKQIAWLLAEYNRILQENNNALPSIIAHSFGTYQVAELIERYPNVKFDKVIFAASIVRADYDWTTVLDQGRVSFVENDYGGRDLWPKIAARLVGGAGPSGTTGFQQKNDLLNQRSFPQYKHSHYFHYSHFKANWIPTLVLDKRILVETIGAALKRVAKDVPLPATDVEGYVLVPDPAAESRLHTVPGLHKNVRDEAELGRAISTNLGMANSGPATAFTTGQVVISSPEPAPAGAPPPALPLKFTLSIPIIGTGKRVLGIFNIRLGTVEQAHLKPVGDTMVAFAQAMAPTLEVLTSTAHG